MQRIFSEYHQRQMQTVRIGSQDQAYGKADIYDATGNLVQSDLPVQRGERPGVYGIFWSFRNRHTRTVGSGSYLVLVTTTDVTGKKSTRRIMIGVQR